MVLRARGKKNKLLRAILLSAAALLLLGVLLPFLVAGTVYSFVFGSRITTPAEEIFENTSGEIREEAVSFSSLDGNLLAGCFFTPDAEPPKALAIWVHGMGSGSAAYRKPCLYLAEQGFAVLAYDTTGNDGSEGKNPGGFPQFTKDLAAALDYVSGEERWNELPVCLLGHSVGGYAVCSVLNFREGIAAVVTVSGFDRSTDMIRSYGVRYGGKASLIFAPYVDGFERLKFGKYAGATGTEGLKKADCPVLVIHGENDGTVGAEYGWELWAERFAGDERFRFLMIPGAGHSQDEVLDDGVLAEIAGFLEESLNEDPTALPDAA